MYWHIFKSYIAYLIFITIIIYLCIYRYKKRKIAKDFTSKSDYDKIAVLGASASSELLSKNSQIIISSGDLHSTYDPTRRRTRSNSNISDKDDLELLETSTDLNNKHGSEVQNNKKSSKKDKEKSKKDKETIIDEKEDEPREKSKKKKRKEVEEE